MTETGALWAEQSTDDAEAEALFDARRLAYPALERLGPVLTEDICVPRSKVPGCWSRSARSRPAGVRIATVAHAGDGNLHPLIITPPGDSAARIAAQAAFEQFLDAAIALGGTVTGEHGVGILKRDGMRRELDPGSLALQSAVRRALDPSGVFNPGKGWRAIPRSAPAPPAPLGPRPRPPRSAPGPARPARPPPRSAPGRRSMAEAYGSSPVVPA